MKWLIAFSVLLFAMLMMACSQPQPGIYSQIAIIKVPVGPMPRDK